MGGPAGLRRSTVVVAVEKRATAVAVAQASWSRGGVGTGRGGVYIDYGDERPPARVSCERVGEDSGWVDGASEVASTSVYAYVSEVAAACAWRSGQSAYTIGGDHCSRCAVTCERVLVVVTLLRILYIHRYTILYIHREGRKCVWKCACDAYPVRLVRQSIST